MRRAGRLGRTYRRTRMTNDLVEAQIPVLTASGPDRFAELVHRHQAMVFSMALAHLRNRAIAEDIAQEVFMELYRRLPSLESDAHVTNWLRRVTVHRLIDQAREWKRKPQDPKVRAKAEVRPKRACRAEARRA